ncbi:hypothetical protein FRB99_005132, partial [Tulasnella sp. 403]
MSTTSLFTSPDTPAHIDITPDFTQSPLSATVSNSFRQLPDRIIGLRIAFGGAGLGTQFANGSKNGHWQLRAEVPEIPGAGNSSPQPLKIKTLEANAVINSVEFGLSTSWDT